MTADTYLRNRRREVIPEDGYTTKYVVQHSSEASIYDRDNAKSIVNLVPMWFAKRIESPGVTDLLTLSEEDLAQKVKPTLTLKRLRIGFWTEYERLFAGYGRPNKHKHEQKMGIYRMCNGICTPQFFMDKIVRNDHYLAWIVRPPLDYAMAMEEALQFGLERLREILNMPLYEPQFNKDGLPVLDPITKEHYYKPNEKIANLILKTVALIDVRVHGMVPQRVHTQIDQRSMNYHKVEQGNQRVTVDAEKLDNKILSIEDLDDKIKSLTKETGDMINNPMFSVKEKHDIIYEQHEEIRQHMKKVPNESSGDEA